MSRSPTRLRGLRRKTSARLFVLAGTLTIAVAGAAAAGPIAAGSTSGSLEGRIAASQAREGELHAGIGADTLQSEGLQGSIEDLQTRLDTLESSLDVERNLLDLSLIHISEPTR